MPSRRVTEFFQRKFPVLQPDVSGHPFRAELPCQIESVVVVEVPSHQRDELKFVTHRRKVNIELCDRFWIEILFPVERRRTIIGHQLIGKILTNRFSEHLCLFEIRLARFKPQQIRIGRIRLSAGNRDVHAVLHFEVSFRRALACQELLVPGINVRRHVGRAQSIGACHQNGRYLQHVGSEPGRDQVVDSLLRRQ